jgi:hypothetical protein
MKYCPNQECPHFESTGTPAEFLDEIEICSDCGTRLVWGEVEEAIIGEPEPVKSMVVIARFKDVYQAYLAKGKLGSEGIEAFFQDIHNANVEFISNFGYEEIKLVVAEADAQRALEILNEDHSQEFVDDKNDNEPVDP